MSGYSNPAALNTSMIFPRNVRSGYTSGSQGRGFTEAARIRGERRSRGARCRRGIADAESGVGKAWIRRSVDSRRLRE